MTRKSQEFRATAQSGTASVEAESLLSPEEVAALVRARQILKSHGLRSGFSVKDVSEWAGVSRKTAYAQEKRERAEYETLEGERSGLRSENEALREQCELNQIAMARLERDLRALQLTKRAYEELKKSEAPESRKARRHR